MRTPRPVRIVAIGLLLAAIAGTLVYLPTRENMTLVLAWIEGLGLWGPVLLVCGCALTGPLLIPESIPTLAAGYLFGLTGGTAAALAGSCVAATATFLVGRTLLREPIELLVASDPRFRAIDRAIGYQGLKVVLVVRLSPLLNFGLVSYLLSITRTSYRHYLLGTLAGTLPGTFMYVYLGSTAMGLADLITGEAAGGAVHVVLLAAGVGLSIAATLVISRIARRALDDMVAVENASPVTEGQETNG